MSRLEERGHPEGWQRWAARAPLALYRARLGFLLGGRFLRLVHRGRKSGARRETVLEVVGHLPDDTYLVASGWGEGSQWFRNLLATPECEITVRNRTTPRRAERLSLEEATARLTDYAARHPRAFRGLTRLMLGEPAPADETGAGRLAEVVPVVALRPA